MMGGAADWAATILFAIFAGWASWKVLMWMADKVIAAIDWMTRFEP